MINAAPFLLYLTALPSLGGVLIGHPTGLVNLHHSVHLDSFEANIERIDLVDVNGNAHSEPVHADVDLLNDVIPMPPGRWIEATLMLDGPVRATGSATAHGGTFELEIGVGAIFLQMPEPVDIGTDPLSVESSTIVFGNEDFLTANQLGLHSPDHVVIDAAHAIHDTIRASLRFGSTWRQDPES